MAALFEQQFAGRELWAGYEIENEGSQRYLIVPSRLALRPDLYETLKGFGVPSLSAADIADHANKSIYSQYACHPISGDSEFNRYLGFIELRMHSVQAPIALAVLAVPRQLRHAQNVTVMTGTYGPIFGGPGFSSTVYSMQDQGGGKCAQGCAIMVLGMLSDRGASVLGSLSVTYLASDPHDIRRVHSDSKSQVRSPKGCLKKKNHQKVMSVEGLNFNELNRLFQSSECGTTVSGYRFESNEQRLAIRVVESYVTARMPPIILVQDRAWEKSDDISVAEDKLLDGDSDFVGHAVVVVGFRKFKKDKKSQLSGSPTLPDSLIVHDPGYSPYFERSSRHVFGAGLGFEHRAGQEHRNKFHAIFAAPKTIKTHLLTCLGELLQSEDGSDVVNWEWFVAEALNANDLTQQAASDQRDFQFSHIHKEDVGELLFSDTQSRDAAHERAEKDDWRQAVDKIQGSWCWVVRCFENKCLRIAWIFEANVDIKNQWRDWSQFLVPWAARVVANDLEASHADSSNDRFTFEHSIRRQDDQPARAIDIETLNQPFVGKEGLKHKNRLRASVISSSSERRLTDFIREVRQVSRVRDFDIYLLRSVDLNEIDAYWSSENRKLQPSTLSVPMLDTRSPTEMLAQNSNVGLIHKWIVEQFRIVNSQPAKRRQKNARISALATYYPDVSSRSKELRSQAIEALVNTVKLALQLKEEGLMKQAIVEIVCGTLLDTCNCADCKKSARDETNNLQADEAIRTDQIAAGQSGVRCSNLVYKTSREKKLKLLQDSLSKVVKRIRKDLGNKEWFLALELEPGVTYVLKDGESLKTTFDLLFGPNGLSEATRWPER